MARGDPVCGVLSGTIVEIRPSVGTEWHIKYISCSDTVTLYNDDGSNKDWGEDGWKWTPQNLSVPISNNYFFTVSGSALTHVFYRGYEL